MFTFALITTIATALSGLASTFINAQNEKAAAKMYDYQAAVEQENAKAARQQGAYAEDLQRQQARKQQAALRASGAESGVSSGTFYDVSTQSALGAEMDALATRYNYEMKAVDARNQSNMYKAQSRQARTASKQAVVGGLMSTTASTLNSAYTYWGK